MSLCDYYVLEGMERKITAKTTPSPCVLLHRGPKYFNNYYDKLLLQSLCSFVVLFAELLICVSALSSETRHVSYSLYRKGKKRKKKTVLTQEPTKSNHSLWMAISRFDQVLCYSNQRAGGQERVKVTRLLSREKTRPDIMLSCHILLQ